MTIEERAYKLYRLRYLKGEERERMRERRKDFLLGATEQKQIDDKAMDMLNEACDNTIALLKEEHKRELNELIAKACELFRKECEEANGLIKSVCDRNIGDLINVDASVKSFRKKLED